jgi:malate synthase
MYDEYVTPALKAYLAREAKPFDGVPDLYHVGESGGLENTEAMRFLCQLYSQLQGELENVLQQRRADREFIDQRTAAMARLNDELGLNSNETTFHSVLGLEDGNGRIVVGPKRSDYWRNSEQNARVAPLPEHLQGAHVTLFGPPDNAKMCVNAMNAYHRKLAQEPPIVAELLSTQRFRPMWGADDEDSKTPLREDLISAGENLARCFDHSIHEKDEGPNGRT